MKVDSRIVGPAAEVITADNPFLPELIKLLDKIVINRQSVEG